MLTIMYVSRGPSNLPQTALEQGLKEMRPKSLLFRRNTQFGKGVPNSAEHKEKHLKNVSKCYQNDQSIT